MAVDPLLQGLVSGFAAEAQEVCQKVTMDLLDLERGGLDNDALEQGLPAAGAPPAHAQGQRRQPRACRT